MAETHLNIKSIAVRQLPEKYRLKVDSIQLECHLDVNKPEGGVGGVNVPQRKQHDAFQA